MKLPVLVASTLWLAAPSNAPPSPPPGDPSSWPPEQDAVVAAPQNHRVIFEDEAIRILSVTVRPGEREPLHHHRWPSVLVIDSFPRLVDHDAAGNVIPRKHVLPSKIELPFVVRLKPQAAHAIENHGTKPFHAIRVEYKRGYPEGPADGYGE